MRRSVKTLVGGVLLFLIESSFGDETLRGVVVENNMEDPDVGAYLHVAEQNTGKRVFVIYEPSDANDETCLAKMEGYWVARGDVVDIRGEVLKLTPEGKRPAEHTLTTCTKESYIRAKRFSNTARN